VSGNSIISVVLFVFFKPTHSFRRCCPRARLSGARKRRLMCRFRSVFRQFKTPAWEEKKLKRSSLVYE
jgi:hypothetical protein